MRFPYFSLPTRRPVYSLGGAAVRHRPMIRIEIAGPLGSRLFDGALDSGTDDTLFPRKLAAILGIHLTRPPDEGEALPIAGRPITYAYGKVKLRVADAIQAYEWDATVGFIDTPLIRPLLGHAGFLQFFDVQLQGAAHETILHPNASFPGTIQHRPSSP